ncbi:hypothetical protein DAI22_04g092800 [Oryza sativa Japonica Group]|nr:hypothetical protein DAI22_04g092800 [Oryza sativa Japonica Group]
MVDQCELRRSSMVHSHLPIFDSHTATYTGLQRKCGKQRTRSSYPAGIEHFFLKG